MAGFAASCPATHTKKGPLACCLRPVELSNFFASAKLPTTGSGKIRKKIPAKDAGGVGGGVVGRNALHGNILKIFCPKTTRHPKACQQENGLLHKLYGWAQAAPCSAGPAGASSSLALGLSLRVSSRLSTNSPGRMPSGTAEMGNSARARLRWPPATPTS